MVDIIKLKNRHGFTIIEVLLFLGLTGLIFLIVILSINGRIAQSQFTESMRDMQSYLQLKQQEVFDGVSDGVSIDCEANTNYLIYGGSPGNSTATQCVNLGRAMVFGTADVSTYTVFGKLISSGLYGESDYLLIEESKPSRYDFGSSGVEYKSFRWDLEYYAAKRPDGSIINNTLPMAFIRSPSSSRIITLAYTGVSSIDVTSTSNDYSSLGLGNPNIIPVEDKPIELCFQDGDQRRAHITIAGGSQDLIQLVFEEGCL